MENKFYDVIIIGAGPSGLSASLFLADAELDALVIGDGRTQLKSAWVDNYLGLEPFNGVELAELGRKQAEARGVSLLDAKVTAVQTEGEKIVIVTEAAGTFETDELIIASGQGPNIATAELAGVELVENNEPFTKLKIKIDEQHRTSVPNIWATGIAAGIGSQAIIAAGHGAQTALNLISARAEERVVYHKTPAKK